MAARELEREPKNERGGDGEGEGEGEGERKKGSFLTFLPSSADEDARREEDGVDAGIDLSSLNWRDSGNESVFVVEGDGLGFPRSLKM